MSPFDELNNELDQLLASLSSRKACLDAAAPPSPEPPSPPSLDELRQDFMRVLASLSVFSTKTLQAAVRSDQMTKFGSLYNLFTAKEIPLEYDYNAMVRSRICTN